MLYKCNFCDPTAKVIKDSEGKRIRQEKQVKTVDTSTGDFIRDKGKYYHIECFKQHLSQRKKIDTKQFDDIVAQKLAETKVIVREAEEKDNFLKWIMEFYDGSLPAYFLKKLQTVRDGNYEGLNESIDYSTLLDIYIHMERYLNNQAIKKGFNEKNIAQRMNYDLAVVVGNYNDYKRYKERQRQEVASKTIVAKALTDQKRIEEKNKTISTKKDEFNLSDVLDDLLL